jgi:ankyrin repeat protein
MVEFLNFQTRGYPMKKALAVVSENCEAIFLAAKSGDIATLRSLREKGAAIQEKDANGNTALLHAAYNGHLATVQWLLKKGGATIQEKNNKGTTALLSATCQGHLATVKWLLEKGGATIQEKDTSDNTALLLAAGFGHLAIVQ